MNLRLDMLQNCYIIGRKRGMWPQTLTIHFDNEFYYNSGIDVMAVSRAVSPIPYEPTLWSCYTSQRRSSCSGEGRQEITAQLPTTRSSTVCRSNSSCRPTHEERILWEGLVHLLASETGFLLKTFNWRHDTLHLRGPKVAIWQFWQVT